MPYFYTDPKREDDPYSLPDVEVFADYITEVYCECGVSLVAQCQEDGPCPSCGKEAKKIKQTGRMGYFYAFGFPGCMWDSDLFGPYDTEDEAVEEARELAGVYQ